MKAPIGSLDPRYQDVHIYGAGIAGLLIAYFLKKKNYRVHLYERAERVGGKIRSHQTPRGVIEEGPNAIYATQEIEDFLTQELALKIVPATPKLKRRIWRKRPEAPLSLSSVLKLVPRLLKKAPPISDDTTLAEFFRPLLGTHVEDLLSPALQGIYAVGAEQLTMKSLWPELEGGQRYLKTLKSLRGPRARSLSFAGGMQELVDALAQALAPEIHLNHHNFELRPNTILCTDAQAAAELLGAHKPTLAAELRRVRYLPVSSVTADMPADQLTHKTFGLLFPRQQNIESLGVLFNTEIFPHRIGRTFILQGHTHAEERVQQDLQRLGWQRPASSSTHSWERGLPLYDGARARAVASLRRELGQSPGLVLFGNYATGISLRDMFYAAKSV